VTVPFERDFDPSENFPSVVMDALQRMLTALGDRPCPVRIKAGAANTLYVPAGTGQDAAGAVIDGAWRWNESSATSEQAGSGSAGQRDVWACTAASDYEAGTPGETDATDRSFVLRITAVDAAAPGGFAHTRKVARGLWNGTIWLDVVPFVGGILVDPEGARPGTIKAWPFSWEPIGWEFCDATALAAASPSVLRDQLEADGALFGSSGSDPRIPDLRERVPVGAGPPGTLGGRLVASMHQNLLGGAGGEGAHSLIEAEGPSHQHWLNGFHYPTPFAASVSGTTINYQAGASPLNVFTYSGGQGVSDRTELTGSGNPHENVPPYQIVNWIIKV
jgi:microcystin-dependent protein